MKVLVCGSRDWADEFAVRDRVRAMQRDDIVITGAAMGADHFARHEAARLGLWVVDVPVLGSHWRRCPGRSAGHERNAVMLDLGPDLVVAFQRNGSSGTQGTIDEASRRGIPVEVHTA